MITILLIFAIAFVLSWVPALVLYLVARRRESGDRVTTCPETRKTAVVRLDAGHAAWTDLRGEKELRLESCSRWPERADCGRECLREVETAPDGCLVRERLETFYRGARCAFCGLWIGSLHWFEIRPGLLTPERRLISWVEIPAADLPAAVARNIGGVAREVYRALDLSGYARIDLRLTRDGQVYLIEANPNPQIAREEDFADSAAAVGMDYHSLLQRILALGMAYQPLGMAA